MHNRYPLYLLVLAVALFLPFLGTRDLWAPVEPRYAEITRVMFERGEWIVPTINGRLYTDKPILYFWIALVASKLAGGVNEWTVRLPAALGAIGAVFTTYLLGRDFFSRRIGFVAAAVFATSLRVIWEGRWAHLDMLFTCFFALSMYFAARAIFKPERRNEVLAAYACMALATLTKGLIGVVLPALTLSAFVLLRRDWRLLLEARLIAGFLIFVALTAPWLVAVSEATGGQWLKDFVFIHHIQRYTGGTGHREPFYYYLTTLPLDFVPWTLFAVPAVFAYGVRRDYPRAPLPLFFSLWFVAVFLFFSASSSKRELYLLPLLPPLALLVAGYVDDLLEGNLALGRFHRGLLLAGFNLLWIASVASAGAAWFMRRDAFPAVLPPVLALAAGGLAAVHFVRRGAVRNLVIATSLMMVLASLAAAASLLPFLERYKSPRPFAERVKEIVPADAPLYIYADSMNDFNFYLGREVITVISRRAGWEPLLAEQRAAYVLIQRKDLKTTPPSDRLQIVITETGEGRSWCLIALAAPSESTYIAVDRGRSNG